MYSVDRSKAEAPEVVFFDHSFLALPLEDGGFKHRWLRQDGYSVGPVDWTDSSKVEAFDLLKLGGVSWMCFEKGPDDEKLVAELGDLESLDDDFLASKVRGVVTSIAKSLDVFSPGIQKILENSKTRDPHGELAAEIDYAIARAKEVNAPAELVQKLEDLKRASEGSYWDTSFDVGLLRVQEQLSNLKDERVSETATEGPWTVLVFRFPLVSPDTPEGREEREALQAVGYQPRVVWYGESQHETREEAEAAAKDRLRQLKAQKPTISWHAWVGQVVS